MANTLKMTAAALAASMALSGTAQAATALMQDMTVTETAEVVATGGVDSFTFDFSAAEALKLTGLSIAATGGSGGADLAQLAVDFFINGVLTGSSTFDPVIQLGTAAFGGAGFTPPSYNLMSGDTFSFTISEVGGNIMSNVGLTSTVVTAPVPVPAAGFLMLSLLAAGGYASRRRNRKAANA